MSKNDDSPRSFSHFFGMLDDEQAHATASEDLHDLMKVMRDEASARQGSVGGSLTIRIDFKVDETGTVETRYDVKTKEPKRKSSKSIFWLTKNANLTVSNPRQQELPLRQVSAQGAALRDVDADYPAAMKEI